MLVVTAEYTLSTRVSVSISAFVGVCAQFFVSSSTPVLTVSVLYEWMHIYNYIVIILFVCVYTKMKCLEAHPSLMNTGGGCWPDSSRMGTGPRPCSQHTGHLCLPSAALLPLSLTYTQSQRRDRAEGQGWGQGWGRQGGLVLSGPQTKATIVPVYIPPYHLSSNVK